MSDNWNSPAAWIKLTTRLKDGATALDFLSSENQARWEGTRPRLHKLWTMLRPIGLLVPATPLEFLDMMFTPNNTRALVMIFILKKIFPFSSFWEDPVMPESMMQEISAEDFLYNFRITKCTEVCQWFGFSQEGLAIQGMSNTDLQFDIWFNIIQMALDMKSQQRNMVTTILLPSFSLIEDCVLQNTAVLCLFGRNLVVGSAPATLEIGPLSLAAQEAALTVLNEYKEVKKADDIFSVRRGELNDSIRALTVGIYQFFDAYIIQSFIGGPSHLFVKLSPQPPPKYGIYQVRTDISECARNLAQFIRHIEMIGKVEAQIRLKIMQCVPGSQIMLSPHWTFGITSAPGSESESKLEVLTKPGIAEPSSVETKPKPKDTTENTTAESNLFQLESKSGGIAIPTTAAPIQIKSELRPEGTDKSAIAEPNLLKSELRPEGTDKSAIAEPNLLKSELRPEGTDKSAIAKPNILKSELRPEGTDKSAIAKPNILKSELRPEGTDKSAIAEPNILKSELKSESMDNPVNAEPNLIDLELEQKDTAKPAAVELNLAERNVDVLLQPHPVTPVLKSSTKLWSEEMEEEDENYQ